MKTIILHHRVKDFTDWKKIYDADADRRNKAGIRQIALGTKPDDKHEVYIVFQTDDTDVIQKMMNDQNLKDLQKKAGVIRGPDVIVLD
jgi:hypothetical protein